MGYYVGNSGVDAPAHRGRLVGTFMEEGPRKTEAVEIKYAVFEPIPNDHNLKTSDTIECDIILSGKTEGIVGDEHVTLEAGDYIVIDAGTPNNLIEHVLEKLTIVTIKAPSDPSAKKIVEAV